MSDSLTSVFNNPQHICEERIVLLIYTNYLKSDSGGTEFSKLSCRARMFYKLSAELGSDNGRWLHSLHRSTSKVKLLTLRGKKS